MALAARQALTALKHRGFRTFWSGRLLARATMQMRQVARGWLVYSMTESALALTWVASARAVAVLMLAPLAGVLTDRLDKRAVLCGGTLVQALTNGILAALVLTGRIEVWHVVVSALVEGLASSFVMPAQNAIVGELVPRQVVMNAFSSIAMSGALMGIFGAAAAGQLAEWVGAGAVFALLAAIHVVVAVQYGRLPASKATATGRKLKLATEWLDGIRTVRCSTVLTFILILGFVRHALLRPYSTLLPAFAAENLGMSASGLGWLTSANLMGALVFSLAMGALGDSRGKGRFLLGSGLVMAVALILFVGIRWIPSAFLFIAVAGGCSQVNMIMAKTLTQNHTKPEYRGRVNSLRQTVSGLSPILSVPAGMLADQVGVAPVVAGQAMIVIAVFGGVWLFRPRFRNAV